MIRAARQGRRFLLSVKIEKSQETKEHDDVDIIIVLVPRG